MPGILDNLSSTLFGAPGQFRQSPSSYNPQQQQIFQQLGQMGLQGLGTDAIEGQARRGFQQNTIPLLSERFANVAGGLSGIGSSGYQNALQGAGTELESRLAALRQGNAMNLLQLGLTPQNDHYFEEGQEGLAAPLINAGARIGAAYLTGGGSELGNILDLLKSYFTGGQGNQKTGYTGIEADATSPLRERFNQMSGQQLLQGQQAQSLGVPYSQINLPQRISGLGSVGAAQQGGQRNFNRLFGEATLAGLPQNPNLTSRLNPQQVTQRLGQYYPGFAL